MIIKSDFKSFFNHISNYDKKNLLDYDVKSVYHDWRIDDIKFILSKLSCPESCHAFCCKREEVGVMYNDVHRIIENGDECTKEKALNMKVVAHSVDSRFIHMIYTKSPCEFLNENDKCSIHDYSPSTCSIFPFTYKENLYGNVLVIVFGCPLGFDFYTTYKDIIHDEYNKYLRSRISDNDAVVAQINEFNLLCEAWLNEKSDIPKLQSTNILIFPSEILTSIAKRLGKEPLHQMTTQKIKIKNSDRNKSCPCGSGKKYKKCCMNK